MTTRRAAAFAPHVRRAKNQSLSADDGRRLLEGGTDLASDLRTVRTAAAERRAFLIVAGVDSALDYLEHLRFDDADRAWLRTLPAFATSHQASLTSYLAGFSFTGDVWAMPEGTPVFGQEPILRVTAPQPQAQGIVETALLAAMSFQTSVAAKAARIVRAAGGRTIVEFGARRAHGIEWAIAAARSAYVADATARHSSKPPGVSTSRRPARWRTRGCRPLESEIDAFREFERSFADVAVYLLDTFDTLEAARTAGRIGAAAADGSPRQRHPCCAEPGCAADSRYGKAVVDTDFRHGESRRVPDCRSRSGRRPHRRLRRRRGIDGGDRCAVAVRSGQAGRSRARWPACGGCEAQPRQTDVARPQAGVADPRRRTDGAGFVAAEGEAPPAGGVPLLKCVMSGGRRVEPRETLSTIRDRCRQAVDMLPPELRALNAAATYEVIVERDTRTRAPHVSATVKP